MIKKDLVDRTRECLNRAKKPLRLYEIAQRINFKGIKNKNKVYLSELNDALVFLMFRGEAQYFVISETYKSGTSKYGLLGSSIN